MWSSEEECPQHSFFYGQKAEATAGACGTDFKPEQGEVLPKSHGLKNFKKVNNIFFFGGGGG